MKLKLKHLFVAISSLLMSSCADAPSPSHNSDESELNNAVIENNDDSTHFAVSGDESNGDIIEPPEYANDTYLRRTI